jgi:beta-glucanase (GH16 family)
MVPRTTVSRSVGCAALLAALVPSGCAANSVSLVDLAPAEALGATPLGAARVDEPFGAWDGSRWLSGDHPLGRGRVRAANAAVRGGHLLLSLPAGTLEGGEILSSRRVGYGTYEARVRASAASGSLTAFFLYQGVQGGNDEIDIEIPGGTSRIMFTVWVRGEQVHHRETTLPFDPAADFHEYRIEHTRTALRFYVDDVEMARFFTSLPDAEMHVMANAWWPEWLEGGPYSTGHEAVIEWIRY